ncbi:MAG: NAD(P)H-dependent glycerol-3-phosphate dehydrogenase [Eubacterium sp.]
MSKVAVIGAGSWGTALAMTLAHKGHEVYLVVHSQKHLDAMKESGENGRYLPGVKLEPGIHLTMDRGEALESACAVVFAAPAQKFRSAFEQTIPYMDDGIIVVNAAKGIEKGTLLQLHMVAHILRPDFPYVAISGPSHAEEVCRFLPTTVVAASENPEAAEFVQDLFMTDRFRVYTNDDLVGVELGGALKNIIALGAGVSDGIGYGDNAKAALMTRGLTEMIRLGLKMGARQETFAGLTGMGDMIVTCTSMHSRNRRCGILIGQGTEPQKAVEQIGMVVEGITTAEAAAKLARRHHVEMPITQCINTCMKGELTPREAVDQLMTRDRKNEMNFR